MTTEGSGSYTDRTPAFIKRETGRCPACLHPTVRVEDYIFGRPSEVCNDPECHLDVVG